MVFEESKNCNLIFVNIARKKNEIKFKEMFIIKQIRNFVQVLIENIR